MSNEVKRILTKEDIKRCNKRSLMTHIGMFNYQTQNGPHIAYGSYPALRKLYPNDEDLIKSLDNAFRYYNCQPYLSSIIEGAALGMEEELGIPGLEAVNNFKVGLMGPGAGIGDSIFWIIMPSIFTPLAVALAYEGNFAGILISLAYAISLHCLRVRFYGWGYELGLGIVTRLRNYVAPFTDAASILGLTVIGALIPSTVKIKIPLEWTLSTGSVINIQRLLDMLMPNFLAVVVVFISYRLLGKRKVTMIQLVLAVLALSIVGTALGILG